MPIPGTVPLTAQIAPTDPADVFPSHDDLFGKGGYRSVANAAARDAIPAERRREGMLVRTLDDGKYWRLKTDLTTWEQAFAKADVGLENVDNTSDLSKPISTATQTALNGKANLVHGHVLADISDVGTMAGQDSNNVNISGGVIEGYYGLHSMAVFERAKNTTASTIPKGTPVYIVDRTGTHIDVAPADASDPAKMPAIGVAQDAISTSAEGYVHIIGTVTGVNTVGATLGQTVYVASGGGFTTTKPVSPNLIQNMGRVTKVASNGEILVLGPGRTNDVPALANLNVFIGNAGGQATQRQLTAADISGLGAEDISQNGRIERAQDKEYVIVLKSNVAGKITEFTRKSGSGTATVEVRIEGVAVTGLTALTVDGAERSATPSSGNLFAIGATVSFVVSGNANCRDFDFTLAMEAQ